MIYIIQTHKITNSGVSISSQTFESKIPLLSFAFRKAEEQTRNNSSERFFIKAFRRTKKGDKLIYDGNKNLKKE